MKRSISVALLFVALITAPVAANNIWRGGNSVTFEYLPGKKISGTVAEVFSDGTLLVVPDQMPQEWQAEKPGQITPSYFHVDPRAFLLSDSEIGKEYRAYEEEITSLPSTDWRNPPGKLLARGCEFYYKALKKLDAKSLENKGGSPPQITYFGYSSLWATARLRDRGFSNIVDRCDKVWVISEDGDTLRFILSKASEPEEGRRNMLMQTTEGGESKILYILPGDHIMFEKHPRNPDLFFASVDGWPDREFVNPDPRWQSVYLFDVSDPDNYKIVRYPLPASSYAPAGDERLYGHSGFFSEDGRFFYALLYGFEEEGGGLWVADISEDDFYQNTNSFAQVFSWDHALSFFFLPRAEHSPYNVVLMTGKEVNDDFAMTLNALSIKFDGLQSELIEKKRLIKMVGWNPVPFAYKRISDDEILMYVETYFNFESEVVPRVKNVYVVPVKLK
ncbi:MAG: hypothetical protein WAP23_00760 [Candidatus Spechtbacterales bacterium]